MYRSQIVPVALAVSLLGGTFASAQGAKETKPAAPAATPSVVVAHIGDKKITLEELDRKVDPKAFQALYDARKAALDQVISERMLEAEAKVRGVTVAQLVDAEITKKVKPVTEADMQAFFDENKAQMPGGATFDTMKPRLRPFLETQNQQKARQAFVGDLRKKAAVRMLLEPPRAAVTVMADDPSKGPATAPIQIVEFSEFQCPFCSKVGPSLKKVQETYGDQVRVVFRHFPLPFHAQAPAAANASECAREQGKFWEYHDKLFANQTALQPVDLKKYAAELKLDTAKFDACVDGNKFAEGVKKDHADGEAVGVNGTPAFFVNGRPLSGAVPFDAFKQIIDDELELRSAKK